MVQPFKGDIAYHRGLPTPYQAMVQPECVFSNHIPFLVECVSEAGEGSGTAITPFFASTKLTSFASELALIVTELSDGKAIILNDASDLGTLGQLVFQLQGAQAAVIKLYEQLVQTRSAPSQSSMAELLKVVKQLKADALLFREKQHEKNVSPHILAKWIDSSLQEIKLLEQNLPVSESIGIDAAQEIGNTHSLITGLLEKLHLILLELKKCIPSDLVEIEGLEQASLGSQLGEQEGVDNLQPQSKVISRPSLEVLQYVARALQIQHEVLLLATEDLPQLLRSMRGVEGHLLKIVNKLLKHQNSLPSTAVSMMEMELQKVIITQLEIEEIISAHLLASKPAIAQPPKKQQAQSLMRFKLFSWNVGCNDQSNQQGSWSFIRDRENDLQRKARYERIAASIVIASQQHHPDFITLQGISARNALLPLIEQKLGAEYQAVKWNEMTVDGGKYGCVTFYLNKRFKLDIAQVKNVDDFKLDTLHGILTCFYERSLPGRRIVIANVDSEKKSIDRAQVAIEEIFWNHSSDEKNCCFVIGSHGIDIGSIDVMPRNIATHVFSMTTSAFDDMQGAGMTDGCFYFNARKKRSQYHQLPIQMINPLSGAAYTDAELAPLNALTLKSFAQWQWVTQLRPMTLLDDHAKKILIGKQRLVEWHATLQVLDQQILVRPATNLLNGHGICILTKRAEIYRYLSSVVAPLKCGDDVASPEGWYVISVANQNILSLQHHLELLISKKQSTLAELNFNNYSLLELAFIFSDLLEAKRADIIREKKTQLVARISPTRLEMLQRFIQLLDSVYVSTASNILEPDKQDEVPRNLLNMTHWLDTLCLNKTALYNPALAELGTVGEAAETASVPLSVASAPANSHRIPTGLPPTDDSIFHFWQPSQFSIDQLNDEDAYHYEEDSDDEDSQSAVEDPLSADAFAPMPAIINERATAAEPGHLAGTSVVPNMAQNVAVLSPSTDRGFCDVVLGEEDAVPDTIPEDSANGDFGAFFNRRYEGADAVDDETDNVIVTQLSSINCDAIFSNIVRYLLGQEDASNNLLFAHYLARGLDGVAIKRHIDCCLYYLFKESSFSFSKFLSYLSTSQAPEIISHPVIKKLLALHVNALPRSQSPIPNFIREKQIIFDVLTDIQCRKRTNAAWYITELSRLTNAQLTAFCAEYKPLLATIFSAASDCATLYERLSPRNCRLWIECFQFSEVRVEPAHLDAVTKILKRLSIKDFFVFCSNKKAELDACQVGDQLFQFREPQQRIQDVSDMMVYLQSISLDDFYAYCRKHQSILSQLFQIIPKEHFATLVELLSGFSIDAFMHFFNALAHSLISIFSIPNHFWQLCECLRKRKDADQQLAFFVSQPIELKSTAADNGFSDIRKAFRLLPVECLADFVKKQKKFFGELTCKQAVELMGNPDSKSGEQFTTFVQRKTIFFTEIPLCPVFDDVEQTLQLIMLVPRTPHISDLEDVRFKLLTNFYKQNKHALVQSFATDLPKFIDFLIKFNMVNSSREVIDYCPQRIMRFLDLVKEDIFALFRTPQMFQEAIERFHAAPHERYPKLVFLTHSLRKLIEILEPKLLEFTQGWTSPSKYQLISVVCEKNYSHPALLKLIWSGTEYDACKLRLSVSQHLNAFLIEALHLEDDDYWKRSSALAVFAKPSLPNCIVRMREVINKRKDVARFDDFLCGLGACCGVPKADKVSDLMDALNKYRRTLHPRQSVAAAMPALPINVSAATHLSVNHP